MSAVPLNFDENSLYPPRYWWTKRIITACLGMLLALSGAWALWSRTASTRLRNEVDSIRARGELILPEEFNSPAVPDEQNVAEYLNAATAAINTAADPPRATEMEYPDYLPMSAEWYTVAKGARTGNAKSLALVRQARQFTKVDWKLGFHTPVINIALPGLNAQRHLANLMGDVALYEHLAGDDFEAVERLRDLFHAADAVDQQPILVSHLVATGIYALGIQDIFVIAPGLRLADDPSPAPTTQPVTPARREQVQVLIKIMLDRSSSERIAHVYQAERMVQLDSVEWLTRNSVLLKPMYRLDAKNVLQTLDPVVRSATQPSLPAARTTVGAAWPGFRPQPTWTTMMSSMLSSSLNRATETDFKVCAEAAMAAVVLAGRLYQVDHQGKWPANLEELVPNYLPSVPIDPMSGSGKPLGYIILNNGMRPLVYSVGPDDYDQTANGVVPSPLPKVGYEQTVDQWRDLSRFDPPSTTMPAGN